MARQNINVGSAPNDSTGDPLRTAFQKINSNFTEIYANVAASNYRFTNNTMTTTSGDMLIAPPGSADVVIGSTNQLNVSATTSSVSSTTGALIVAGGVGIAGDLNVGGMFYSDTAGFGNIDDTPIGENTPSTGAFTDLIADTADITTVNGGNVISETMYVSSQADFLVMNSMTSNIGEAVAGNLIIGDDGWIEVGNFYSGNVNITGGTITGVGVVYTSIEDTPIGVTTPSTAVFTSTTTDNLSTGNARITTGYINGAIGSNTANTGVFTTLTATSGYQGAISGPFNGTIGASNPNSVVATSLTTTSGGQITGYHTGAIGANTANTGVFTSITTVSGGQITGYYTGVIGANVANAGIFTTLTATSGYQGAISGPFNGIVGGVTPNIGTFSDLTVNGTLSVPNNNIVGNVTGDLTGTASSATTAGTATYASTAGLASAATTVVQASQPNITSTGTLVSLNVTGTTTVGNLNTSGNISATGNVKLNRTIELANNNGGTSTVFYMQYNSANTAVDFVFV